MATIPVKTSQDIEFRWIALTVNNMSKSGDGASGKVLGGGKFRDEQYLGDGRILLTRAENMVLVMDTPKGTLEVV